MKINIINWLEELTKNLNIFFDLIKGFENFSKKEINEIIIGYL